MVLGKKGLVFLNRESLKKGSVYLAYLTMPALLIIRSMVYLC